jgi:hypothetical protein
MSDFEDAFREHEEFATHKLNDVGFKNAELIKKAFNDLLSQLEIFCVSGRQFSIVKTKLEEACFFAKKAMAIDLSNQVKVLPEKVNNPILDEIPEAFFPENN